MEDIAVVFDDTAATEIQVNAGVLMLASPIFKSVKEAVCKKIQLPGKDPQEFRTLISFLLPGSGRLQTLSVENVDFLLKWCQEYCIDALRCECLEFIRK